MRRFVITGLVIVLCTLFSGCCKPGDNACYKAWWGLEPHPTDPNKYTDPFDRWFHPELRNLPENMNK